MGPLSVAECYPSSLLSIMVLVRQNPSLEVKELMVFVRRLAGYLRRALAGATKGARGLRGMAGGSAGRAGSLCLGQARRADPYKVIRSETYCGV